MTASLLGKPRRLLTKGSPDPSCFDWYLDSWGSSKIDFDGSGDLQKRTRFRSRDSGFPSKSCFGGDQTFEREIGWILNFDRGEFDRLRIVGLVWIEVLV